MSEEIETARVTMVWPKDLKEAVRQKAGVRGMTEFVIEGAQRHLQDGDSLHDLEVQLNETKHLVQLLADRLVMGGSSADRLEALMEVEFPSWVDTTGWPSEMAKRVKPEILEEVERTPVVTHVNKAVKEPAETGDPTEPEPEPTPTADRVIKEEKTPIDELPHVSAKGKDDFFARIMEKTGGKMEGFEGLKDAIKPASEIPQPDPKPQDDRCPTCNEELVDGECWTCS